MRSVSENETDGEFSDPAHPPRVEVAQMHQQQQHIYQQHQQQKKASKTYEELMLAARYSKVKIFVKKVRDFILYK